MTDLFHAMQAEVLAERKPPVKLFVIVAWSRQYGWSLRPGCFLNIETARKIAADLAPCWTEARIYELGEKEQS